MRIFFVILLQLLVLMPFSSFASASMYANPDESTSKPALAPAKRTAAVQAYGRLPLYFVENRGQVDKKVSYYEKGAGHSTFFTNQGVVMALTRGEGKTASQGLHKKDEAEKALTETLSLSFVGADKGAKIIADERLAGHVNYFIGNDHKKWRTGIPTFGAVTYRDVYKNIDIKFYGNNRSLEHDVIVRPGGHLSEVRFAYKGVKGLKITEDGGLEVILENGKITQKKPLIYQEIEGKRVAIDGSYRLLGEKEGAFTYGFEVASYDRTRDLVIDPVIVYSTYLGGSSYDYGYGIAVDGTGAVYVAGQTWSTDFPTSSPLQTAIGGTRDAFVTKINPAGSAIVYSTYFGGSGFEQANAIALDSTGAAYITGWTNSSTDFPLVGAIQGTYGGGTDDVFVTKISPDGSALVYSTYLGGSTNRDEGLAIAVDSLGQAYVTGLTQSLDFPVASAFQPTSNGESAFVSKLNASGSAFVYSTYLGGSSSDQGNAIAVDSSGNAFIAGNTRSSDFPTTLGAFQTTMGINGTLWGDAFVSKMDAVGSSLLYSTFLGGNDTDIIHALFVDSTGAVYATGVTGSSDFPTMNPIQPVYGGNGGDCFVTKLNPAGSALVYSTYLGGSGNSDSGTAIAVDSAGEAYVYGTTMSVDFPSVNPMPGMIFVNGGTPFLTKIDAGGTAWLFSTPINTDPYGSGSAHFMAMDSKGAVYLTGETNVSDYPTVNPIQPALGGAFDAFVTKISDATPPVVTIAAVPDATDISKGANLGYTVTAVDTDAAVQCFDYWEDVSLPGGGTYPAGGTLFGPVHLCLSPGTSQTAHLTHSVPLSAPTGNYVLNSYVGAYISPSFKIVVDEAHFGFNVSMPVSPAGHAATWRLIENGFAK